MWRQDQDWLTNYIDVVIIDQPMLDSLPIVTLKPPSPTIGVSAFKNSYVPYAEIDDIPFIDDDDANEMSRC